ncbi:WXG100 family type VII secretion target [Paenibacillus solani]|uniref:WXG100 family type VII secretion target n=1 Tax=Paenibacillus solani TaxID=1705565 RepID=A0A0M1P600_9BACL|nr:hypothetical protein [Paenibacillus solani]KOP67745.1 hypothetical protein AMS62_22660 [Bacillus sp. FJAT-18019]KOR89901.1 hypothetical protein AM231_12670 [Paenibacillus solani]
MRISVEPESLRTLSRQLQHSSEEYLAITRTLDQAMNSLVWETSLKAAVIDEWQSARSLGEHLGALLAQLGKHLQSKADQFQETDHQYHTILEHAMISTVSPTALFAASGMDSRAILPEYGNNSTVISNPSSAAAAVGMTSGDNGDSAKQAALAGQSWTFTDPSSFEIAN